MPLNLNSAKQLNKVFNKEQYHYAALFCEENIWHLLKKLTTEGLSYEKIRVLFLTNPLRKVPLLNQQAAPPHKIAVWDYHVVLLADINHQLLIFDFDTRLPFVTPVQNYIQYTFISPDDLPKELMVYIRKIPAQSYLEKFYSDRSHMFRHIEACQYPPWPIINADQHQSIKLDRYLDIEQQLNDGSQLFKLSSVKKLEQWLSA